jgi:hypothetical protein
MGGAPSLAAAATAAFKKLALTETDDCPMRVSRDLSTRHPFPTRSSLCNTTTTFSLKKPIVTISVNTSPTTRLQLPNETHMYAKSFIYDAENLQNKPYITAEPNERCNSRKGPTCFNPYITTVVTLSTSCHRY